MNFTVRELSVPASSRAFVWAAREKEFIAIRRRRELRRVDRELEKGNYKAAQSLMKQLQGNKPAGLLGFGSAKLVPKRVPAMTKLELSMFDTASIESLVDSVLRSIKYSLELALSEQEVLLTGSKYAMENESDDSPEEHHQMCLQHEAGHFLVGYLVGVLPRSYNVPNVEDIMQDKFAQGNVQFLGFELLTEENRGKISSKTLNRFLCVILGGLAAEHLVYGYSELLHSDVQKLDGMLRWACFNENEADGLVRWAAVTTLSLLSHHHEARSRLAKAMTLKKSVGFCIDTIENALVQQQM